MRWRFRLTGRVKVYTRQYQNSSLRESTPGSRRIPGRTYSATVTPQLSALTYLGTWEDVKIHDLECFEIRERFTCNDQL